MMLKDMCEYGRYEYLLILLVTFLIFGCVTKPKIHVYARYLSEEENIVIIQKIKELGFTPVKNDLHFPTSVTSSAIIYSPLLRDSKNVELLIGEMNSIGININSVNPLVTGNHWYTKNSIALFLFGSEDQSNGQIKIQDLSKKYVARDCDKSVELELRKNGTYELSSETFVKEDLDLTKGTWEYRQYPYVELRPYKGESWYRYYEMITTVERDKASNIEMLILMPLDTHQLAANCNFVSGTRF